MQKGRNFSSCKKEDLLVKPFCAEHLFARIYCDFRSIGKFNRKFSIVLLRKDDGSVKQGCQIFKTVIPI
jgi:hypothetical protein